MMRMSARARVSGARAGVSRQGIAIGAWLGQEGVKDGRDNVVEEMKMLKGK